MALNSPMLFLAFTVLRFFQLVMALTVCGLYAVDLHNTRVAGVGADGRWIFAEVVGGLSALTAILYMIPVVMRRAPPLLFAWDVIVFLLWVVLFGIFGKLYLNEDPKGNSNIERMKVAVWIDLVNMVLWLISMIAMAVKWWKARKARTQFTGRAEEA